MATASSDADIEIGASLGHDLGMGDVVVDIDDDGEDHIVGNGNDDVNDDDHNIYDEYDDDVDLSGISTFMCPEMYRAVTSGDMTDFTKLIEDHPQISWDQLSPRGNTILHIAASLRHDQLVELIQESRQELVKAKNRTDDTPLHVAASAGHLSTVAILLTFVVSSGSNGDEEQLLRMKNGQENTPLHVALKNSYKEVARVLIDADPEVSYYPNMERKSPLYLAAEAGYVELVQLIMTKNSPRSDISEKKGKSIVHAAITSKNIDVLKAILTSESNQRDLLEAKDDVGLTPLSYDEGLTPLSYAASTGYLDGVQYILEKFPKCAYISNENGRFPIHVASSKDHIKIIEEFLKYCPDSGEMLTIGNGRNILHVAAEAGKARAVRHMLKMPELKMLINERDGCGNTPLHLASEGAHPKVVSILTWDKRVGLNLLNYEGNTALDIIATNSREMPSFRERLTWQALRYAGAQRRSKPQSPEASPNMDNYKNRVETLLLVATLITTVTFAAGFTMPGGFSSSEPNLGMANFVGRRMFHAFLISNTIAMYSSITVVVALIWAQYGDLYLLHASLKLTVPLLGISLTMVSVAFMTGIYLVVSSLYWLANLVLIMGSIFLFILLVLFIPLYNPSSLNHTIPRYIFYYPLRLLIIVTRSDTDRNEGESSFRFVNYQTTETN